MTQNKKSEIEKLFENKLYGEIKDHEKTEKKFELKAGYDDDSNIIDGRKYAQIFDTPDGWFYYVTDGIYTEAKLTEELPKHHEFVEDTYDYIKYAINEHGYDLDESYEAINRDTGIWNDLRKKVESEIQDEFEE